MSTKPTVSSLHLYGGGGGEGLNYATLFLVSGIWYLEKS